MKIKTVSYGNTRRTVVLLILLAVALGLAAAPAQARPSRHGAISGDLFVANQTANTIAEFSPTGDYLGVFASSGLNGPTDLERVSCGWCDL